MSEEHELYVIARKLRYDLTVMQAKVTDLLKALGRVDLPDAVVPRCPECGLETRGPRTLAEHRYVSHDGPKPEHWFDPDDGSSAPQSGAIEGERSRK